MLRSSLIVSIAVTILCAPAIAQERALDSRRLDMYMCDWRDSMPRHTHGSLVERDILTRGDALKPVKACAVLTVANRFSHATLAARGETIPVKLQGEQEILYVLSGNGKMSGGGETVDLYEGVGILVPAGVEFTMKNTGEVDLTMYLINEPTPAGFRPNPKLLVKDENRVQVRSSTGHWAHIVKSVFESKEGLASIGNVLTVALDPMTIGEPHGHGPGSEEIWASISGESLAFIGTQLRWQRPGMAYLAPPGEPASLKSVAAGLSFPHSNLNSGKEQVKFFYFSTLR